MGPVKLKRASGRGKVGGREETKEGNKGIKKAGSHIFPNLCIKCELNIEKIAYVGNSGI
jgi:hypothetical protein